MIDKLQNTYNKLIHQSNLQWALSKSDGEDWKDISDMLQTLSYGFQEAAAYLSHDFPEIKIRKTDREIEIRKHRLSEEPTDEPKIKEEAE